MKLKHYGIALIPLCIVTFLFRIAVIVLAVTPETGYYNGSVLPTVFNVFLAAATLFFASLSFVTKKEKNPTVVRWYRASVFDNIFASLSAILLIASSLFQLLNTLLAQSEVTAGSVLRSPDLWQTVLALISAAFWIFFVTYPRRGVKKEGWKLLSLAPVFYYLVLLVRAFSTSDVVFSKAYGIYWIVSYGMFTAAAINFSKLLCGSLCRRSFLFFVFEGALIMTLRVADAALWLIPGNPYNVTAEPLPLLGDLCLTVWLLALGRRLLRKKKKKPEPETKE